MIEGPDVISKDLDLLLSVHVLKEYSFIPPSLCLSFDFPLVERACLISELMFPSTL